MTKKTIKHSILAVVALLAFLAVPAQRAEAQANYFGISWDLGLTTGETGDYVSSFSWRGMQIDYRRFTSSNVSFGFNAAWQVHHEKSFEVETGSIQDQPISGAVSGQQYRYINAFPFLATAHYYTGSSTTTRLYGGLGAGAYWVERRTEMGLYAFTDDNWHFGVAPELGVMFPVGVGAGYITASAKWHLTFGAAETEYQALHFTIGFAGVSF